MQDFIEIIGGRSLKGEVCVGGAKNAVLPMLIASLLTADRVTYTNVPNLQDVSLLVHLLEHFGGIVNYKLGEIKVETPKLVSTEASYSLVKAMRASFWVLGPLLARAGQAQVALPGGDIIGVRPVDLHISALEQMGAEISIKHGIVYATAKHGLKPANINLKFPSVGATHQILLAASLVSGTTKISNAAKEPEVIALADLLNKMGASIEGAGTDTIVISGRKELKGAEVSIIGDRIEAATYLCSGLITNGDIKVTGFNPLHLGNFIEILKKTGAELEVGENFILAKRNSEIFPVHVQTEPFPGLATDIQAPLMAYLTLANGQSTIEETIFEGRFGHVAELIRMGADIKINGKIAEINGVKSLSGAAVQATDIRAAASLVIAGLAAEGTTQIHEPFHIRRGYSDLEEKMRSLGAEIRTKISDAEDYIYTGC
jgi:UDP-N-acetylglucosamine 1-carboxyvinyltransferase